MTPNTNKNLLCIELTKMISAYPFLTVKDLTSETTNCQSAYYKAIQTISKIINSGDNSGSTATIDKLNVSPQFHIYQWDAIDRRNSLISSTYESFKSIVRKVGELKDSNNITKILIGGYCENNKKYFYFDLKGNAYNFPVDVKLSIEHKI